MRNKDCAIGCLVGLAIGDSLGTTVEFMPRGSFAPLTDIVGGGPFNLIRGYWTDDTSMALAIAYSLLKGKFDLEDQIKNFVLWYTGGHFSSTGTCFDIGNTTRRAIEHYIKNSTINQKYSVNSAGNGSIMRLAPVVLFSKTLDDVIHFSGESSKTTHPHPECINACEILGIILHRCISNTDKHNLLPEKNKKYGKRLNDLLSEKFTTIKMEDISSSGYVVNTLKAALWCFYNTDNFRDAVLLAANLGDDADTVAAVTGQIAGAFYGLAGIPKQWIDILYQKEYIVDLAAALFDLDVK